MKSISEFYVRMASVSEEPIERKREQREFNERLLAEWQKQNEIQRPKVCAAAMIQAHKEATPIYRYRKFHKERDSQTEEASNAERENYLTVGHQPDAKGSA